MTLERMLELIAALGHLVDSYLQGCGGFRVLVDGEETLVGPPPLVPRVREIIKAQDRIIELEDDILSGRGYRSPWPQVSS